MQLALKEAEMCKSNGEAARGAVIVFPNSHISAGQTVFAEHDPLGHSEMNALRKACLMTNKSFKEAILYSTVEPCAMCFAAIYEHGIREVVFGCWDDVNGAISSSRGLIVENFNISFLGGVLAESCYTMCTPTLRESLRYK